MTGTHTPCILLRPLCIGWESYIMNFNELIRILWSLYLQHFEVSGTLSFQKALLSPSFAASLRLISSSSRLDSNCLWVRTGLVPPVTTCLWSSGHSLRLRHRRRGWRPAENNIYPGALVKTRVTPILCLCSVEVGGFLSQIKVCWKWGLSLYCQWRLLFESLGFYLLPPSVYAIAKETIN